MVESPRNMGSISEGFFLSVGRALKKKGGVGQMAEFPQPIGVMQSIHSLSRVKTVIDVFSFLLPVLDLDKYRVHPGWKDRKVTYQKTKRMENSRELGTALDSWPPSAPLPVFANKTRIVRYYCMWDPVTLNIYDDLGYWISFICRTEISSDAFCRIAQYSRTV